MGICSYDAAGGMVHVGISVQCGRRRSSVEAWKSTALFTCCLMMWLNPLNLLIGGSWVGFFVVLVCLLGSGLLILNIMLILSCSLSLLLESWT